MTCRAAFALQPPGFYCPENASSFGYVSFVVGYFPDFWKNFAILQLQVFVWLGIFELCLRQILQVVSCRFEPIGHVHLCCGLVLCSRKRIFHVHLQARSSVKLEVCKCEQFFPKNTEVEDRQIKEKAQQRTSEECRYTSVLKPQGVAELKMQKRERGRVQRERMPRQHILQKPA